MKKIVAGLVMALVASLVAVFGTVAPANAAVYNCTNESRTISWYDGDISGTASATVHWVACDQDPWYAPVRNNAKKVVLKLNAGNCATVAQAGFNVSNIEGYDLGKKWLPCVEGSVVTRTYDIETPGFTYETKNWYVEGAWDWKFPIIQCTCWTKHGPKTWGGH